MINHLQHYFQSNAFPMKIPQCYRYIHLSDEEYSNGEVNKTTEINKLVIHSLKAAFRSGMEFFILSL